jgi:hypothetical protein
MVWNSEFVILESADNPAFICGEIMLVCIIQLCYSPHHIFTMAVAREIVIRMTDGWKRCDVAEDDCVVG